MHVTPEGHEIDLHPALVVGPDGLWMEPDELFHRTVGFRLADRSLRRLDDTGPLLHACVHAALGQRAPFAQQLRDVRQAEAVGSIEVDAFEDVVGRWRLGPVVSRAFELEAIATGLASPKSLQGVVNHRPSERDHRLLEAYASGRRGRGGTALAALHAISGVRDRLDYAIALAFPRREFLEQRSGAALRGRLNRLGVPIGWILHRWGSTGREIR